MMTDTYPQEAAGTAAPQEHVVSAEVGGREVTFRSGRLAPQAGGAVSVQVGDSLVLATATAAHHVREGIDFFPLSVDLEDVWIPKTWMPGAPGEESLSRGEVFRVALPVFQQVYRYMAGDLDLGRLLATEGADYEGLLRFSNAVTLYDEHGHDTLWNTVLYGPAEQREINDALRLTYALLKSDGDLSTVEHLYVDRVDLCLYGNTLPFRVRIVNESSYDIYLSGERGNERRE